MQPSVPPQDTDKVGRSTPSGKRKNHEEQGNQTRKSLRINQELEAGTTGEESRLSEPPREAGTSEEKEPDYTSDSEDERAMKMYKAMMQYMKPSVEKWARFGDAEARSNFFGLRYSIENWVSHYALRDIDKSERLSADEKQSIIVALDGYCVQETWDYIVERLPDRMRRLIADLFAEACISKHIVQEVLTNPFFYFEGEEGEGTAGPVDKRTPTQFGTHLYHLYKRFLAVDDKYADEWRLRTIRLANAMPPYETTDRFTGEKYKQLRRSAAERLAHDMLNNGVLKLLLREVESDREVRARYNSLVDVYVRAAEMSVSLWSEPVIFYTYRLDELEEPFRGDSEKIEAHLQHWLRSDDRHRLDNRPIIAMTFPAVYRRFSANRATDDNQKLWKWSPAVVLLEDRGPVAKED